MTIKVLKKYLGSCCECPYRAFHEGGNSFSDYERYLCLNLDDPREIPDTFVGFPDWCPLPTFDYITMTGG